jgi:hypothetical protein
MSAGACEIGAILKTKGDDVVKFYDLIKKAREEYLADPERVRRVKEVTKDMLVIPLEEIDEDTISADLPNNFIPEFRRQFKLKEEK